MAKNETIPLTVEALPKVIIKPSRSWVPLRLHEFWQYRELLYFLTWRDIKVRYKQTVLGAAWAIVQPLFMMIVFSLFFGKLAKIPSGGIPYPIFAYAGLLPWQLFSRALTDAGTSLVMNERLITKIYFPRLIVPTSVVLAALVDFVIAFVILILMMFYYRTIPTSAVLAVPLFVLLALITALGASFWLSAMDVQYRDVRYTIPFLTQFWLFATPVVYPSSIVPASWRVLYGLNPMVGVVEGFRWALLGKSEGPGPLLAVSTAMAFFMFVSGLYYFRRMDKTFADVV
jgi:lipopolysaccharide transport system permease protein